MIDAEKQGEIRRSCHVQSNAQLVEQIIGLYNLIEEKDKQLAHMREMHVEIVKAQDKLLYDAPVVPDGAILKVVHAHGGKFEVFDKELADKIDKFIETEIKGVEK